MRERSKHAGRRGRLAYAVLAALLLHAQTVVLLVVAVALRGPVEVPEDLINVTALDDESAREALAALERSEAEKRAEEERDKAKKEEEQPQAPGQVVDIDRPLREVRPARARYAAEHDSQVARETRRRGPPGEAASPGMLAMRSNPPRPQPPPGQPARPAPPPQPGAALPGQSPETEPAPPPGPQERPPEPGVVAGPPSRPVALLPSQEVLARALGGGTSDHLPDVDDGSETALNAKKWKFASFFNRVKEQIRQHWRAAQEYQKRDPTGELYGGRARFTVLHVELKRDGSLTDVQVEQGSGVDFLDDVAVTAVKEAQPFPNPPQQLIDGSGRIRFKFGFIVDVEGGPRLKMYRYSSM